MEAIIAHDIRSDADVAGSRTAARTGFDNGVPSVFIIDGDTTVRQSLERLIRGAGWKPEPFASAEDFLSHRRNTGPCCVILDLTLPGRTGLALQRQLAGRADMPIIFLARQADVPLAVQAMQAG